MSTPGQRFASMRFLRRTGVRFGRRRSKQDFGKVETGFPTKILLNQENLSRHRWSTNGCLFSGPRQGKCKEGQCEPPRSHIETPSVRITHATGQDFHPKTGRNFFGNPA
jgi:hypothetical protein